MSGVAWALVVVAFGFAWSMGAHYTGACMGMPYAARTIRLWPALVLMAILTLLGATFLSHGVLATVGHGIIRAQRISFGAALAVVSAAFVLTTIFNALRIPTSTIQILVFSIAGVGLALGLSVRWDTIARLAVLWAIAPLAALALGFAFTRLLDHLPWFQARGGHVAFVAGALVAVGALASLTMGANDVSNATAVFLTTNLFGVFVAGLVGGLGLALGVITWGKPLLERVAFDVVKMDLTMATAAQGVQALVVDKTGTLTEGKPKLRTVQAGTGFDECELLRLVASIENASEHPLAAAIVAGAADRGIGPDTVSGFESITGKGVRGTVAGRAVLAGNRRLMEDNGIAAGGLAQTADALRSQGETVMLVAVDGKPAGLVSVADPIKASTPEAVHILKQAGLRIVMLTGDNRATAEAIARELGIDEIHAEVLPQDKYEIVKRLQSQGRIVAMAGDGINDAPALAQAQVGIAMGSGTDVAMESARVVLVKGDLRGIAKARRLSRKTMRNIRQNLFFAFVYNALGIPLAAGVLFPAFGLLLSPIIAGAAMSFSSVSVIGNALRLRQVPL